MTVKRSNWLPNERVDVIDQDHGTVVFPVSLENQVFNRFLKDEYSRVATGFRVEIADQVTSPGLFTIINGVAIGQDGQLTSNEDEYNAARSYSLFADATYYIEIEFITNEADTDARAFWDPSFDNGLDVSGDVLPDGKEFSQNVATRLSHDWHISTPISTSGFSSTTDPDSLKIPIAILTVSGGAITGITTSAASSCVAQTILIGENTFRIFDSRIFPDGFDIEVGVGLGTSETVTVTDNDRENGLLTISGTFANNHDIGERVVEDAVAPPQFLDERGSSLTPLIEHDPIIQTVDGDARQRFWQGNEEVGFGLSQDPYGTGASDLQVKQLKDYVDFLSAQIREMKWGSARSACVGDTSPPTIFTTTPHYYEYAGSLMGSRSNTVSVGNGTTSFGDFNTTQSGSAQAALQAAVNAIPAAGGILYVKSGTYSITATTVTIAKPIVIIGDGLDSSIIAATGAVPAFTIDTGGGFFHIENLSLTATSTSVALDFNHVGTVRVSAKNCLIHGVTTSSTGNLDKSKFELCDFTAASTLTSGIAMSAEATNTIFERCNFVSNAAIAGARAINLETSSSLVAFKNCTVASNSSATAIVTLAGATAVDIDFIDCTFTGLGAQTVFDTVAGGNSRIKLINCVSTATNGLGTFSDPVNHLLIDNCAISFGANQVGITLAGDYPQIRKTTFTQTATAAGTGGKAIVSDILGIFGGIIEGCVFSAVDFGIYLTGELRASHISNCNFEMTRSGIHSADDPIIDTDIQGCSFSGTSVGDASIIAGIHSSNNCDITSSSISNCRFTDISDGGFTTDSYGIVLAGSGSSFNRSNISNCIFSGIIGDSIARGIEIRACDDSSIVGNQFTHIAETTTVNTWDGIKLGTATTCNISNNAFNGLGNTSSSTAGNSAIKIGNSTTSSQRVSVANNVFEDIQNNALCHCIFIDDFALDISVTGNVWSGSESQMIVIYLLSDDTTVNMVNCSVSNNLIRGLSQYGIAVDFEASGIAEGELAIVGNTVANFTDFGIVVAGGSASNFTQNVVISGNSLRTISGSGTIGIQLDSVDMFTVSNNVVNIDGNTGNLNGIEILSAFVGTINGNTVYLDELGGATVIGIKADAAGDRICISSNMVYVTNATAGSNGMTLGSNCFASGNYVDAGGAVFDIDRTGATNADVETFNLSGATQQVTAGAVVLNLNKAEVNP